MNVINLPKNTFIIDKPIVLKSNTLLRGSVDKNNNPLTIIKLKNNVCYPIIHMESCKNIVIENIIFIGNGNSPNKEESDISYVIKNNCISIRKCKSIHINNCNAYNANSGGIVIAYSKYIKITNCICSNNIIDGIAIFSSENILINKCQINNNKYSGISIDALYKEMSFNIIIIGSILIDNDHFSIWIRNGCLIKNINNCLSSIKHEKFRNISD